MKSNKDHLQWVYLEGAKRANPGVFLKIVYIFIFLLNFYIKSLEMDPLLCFPTFLSRYTLSIFTLKKKSQIFPSPVNICLL